MFFLSVEPLSIKQIKNFIIPLLTCGINRRWQVKQKKKQQFYIISINSNIVHVSGEPAGYADVVLVHVALKFSCLTSITFDKLALSSAHIISISTITNCRHENPSSPLFRRPAFEMIIEKRIHLIYIVEGFGCPFHFGGEAPNVMLVARRMLDVLEFWCSAVRCTGVY